MCRFYTLIFLFAVCFLPVAQAVNVDDLYRYRQSVQSQSVRVRQVHIVEGLKRVLVKVSGNAAVNTLPAIIEQFSNAQRFVQKYSYHQTKDQGLMLRIDYSVMGVNALLQQAGQAIWSAERPQVLVWLATSREGKQQLINFDSPSTLPHVFSAQAAVRGLRTLMPILDLADLEQINAEDIFQQHLEKLHLASSRYQGAAIMLAALSQLAPLKWQGQFVFSFQGQRAAWTLEGSDPENIIKTGVNNTADVLASRFAMLNVQQAAMPVTIIVENIKNIDDYAKVSRYLKALAPVKDMQVIRVEGARVTYKLQINAGIDALKQTIALNTLLHPDEAQVLSSQALHYKVEA